MNDKATAAAGAGAAAGAAGAATGKPESAKARRARERREAIEHLRQVLAPGDTVYTYLDHVSRSGMARRYRVYAVRPGSGGDGDDGKPRIAHITWYVGRATGARLHDDGRWAIVIGGCGFSGAQEIASSLGYALYGDEASGEMALRYVEL